MMKKVELIASKCYHPSGIITITLVFQVKGVDTQLLWFSVIWCDMKFIFVCNEII